MRCGPARGPGLWSHSVVRGRRRRTRSSLPVAFTPIAYTTPDRGLTPCRRGPRRTGARMGPSTTAEAAEKPVEALARVFTPRREALSQAASDCPECVRLRRIRGGGHRRRAFVSVAHHRRVERYRAEERHAEALRRALPAALGEDRRLLAAVRADEDAHVLHDAEDGHVQLLEHRQRLRRDADRHV